MTPIKQPSTHTPSLLESSVDGPKLSCNNLCAEGGKIPSVPLLSGAGEAEINVSRVGEVKTEVETPEAAGDGTVGDGTARSGRVSRNQTGNGLSGRRLNLRNLCFKGQTSDASLTSHLLLDKQQRRTKRNDDEDTLGGVEKGKRRPRASGDSCFCMLNYSNRWFLETSWTPTCWWKGLRKQPNWLNCLDDERKMMAILLGQDSFNELWLLPWAVTMSSKRKCRRKKKRRRRRRKKGREFIPIYECCVQRNEPQRRRRRRRKRRDFRDPPS